MADRGPKPETTLEIMATLDRMEAITGSATKLPLTRRAVINPKEIQDLVAHIRHALPTDISEALQIIRYRDTLISQAQAEASRLRADAEREARDLRWREEWEERWAAAADIEDRVLGL